MQQGPKLALIGAGHIGGSIAQLAMGECFQDICLIDIVPGLALGKALDLGQSGVMNQRCAANIWGSDTLSDVQDADVIVVTAGLARKPGMSRDDLLEKNLAIFKDIAQAIKTYAPSSFVIVVTNPLDVMVWAMQRLSGLPPERVVGMAGILDTARFRFFLAQALGLSPHDIHTMVMGGHGDLMVPLISHTCVQGIPLQHWISNGKMTLSQVESIIQRTRQGGGEIVALLKTGSAFYAPAAAAFEMAMAYLQNRQQVRPAAAFCQGEYDLNGMYFGVPVILGARGVERVIALKLSPQEQELLQVSAQHVRNLIKKAQTLL
jgi:malate dehydrogenase